MRAGLVTRPRVAGGRLTAENARAADAVDDAARHVLAARAPGRRRRGARVIAAADGASAPSVRAGGRLRRGITRRPLAANAAVVVATIPIDAAAIGSGRARRIGCRRLRRVAAAEIAVDGAAAAPLVRGAIRVCSPGRSVASAQTCGRIIDVYRTSVAA